MCATLADLFAVRSHRARDVWDFLPKLAQRLDETPWYRGNVQVQAGDIAAEPVVLTKRLRDRPPGPGPAGAGRARGSGRGGRSLREEIEAARYELPEWLEEREEIPWRRALARLWVSEGLRRAAAGDSGILPDLRKGLLEGLTDRAPHVRVSMAAAFSHLGSAIAGPGVVGALLKALQCEDPVVRCLAAKALEQMGTLAARPDAVKALVAGLRDPRMDVRCSMVDALGSLGAADSSTVTEKLAGLLKHPDCRLRRSAVRALGKLGQAEAETRSFLPSLLETIGDVGDDVRSSLAEALGRIGAAVASDRTGSETDGVMGGLLQLTGDSQESVRNTAVEALWRISCKHKRRIRPRANPPMRSV
jgi:HEAT repeat protein